MMQTQAEQPFRKRLVVAASRQACQAANEAHAVWAPPPRLTVSEWADTYRYLSPGNASEPGKWSTSRAEYQREVMDAVSDPTVGTVVIMASSQVGKTEIVNNTIGYHVHQDPAPILVVLPSIELGEAWSKERFAPMVRDTPALRGRIAPARGRDGSNTLRNKAFPGGHLTVAGANSPASLASRPIRLLLCDEVDHYHSSAGVEGDAVDLGRKRTTAFWNRKVILASTPLLAGTSRIEAAYEESDKRRYWVPCPHCTEMQVLRWQHVRWTDNDPHTALYHCAGCGVGWTDAERWNAVRGGQWRAERPFRGTAGFHLNELYSHLRRLAETVEEFLAAKGSAERMKVWTNLSLGETWAEQGDAPDWERLFERREPFPMGVVPAGAACLSAGVDNQASPERLEIAVWAWGPKYESWLVDVQVIDGSPAAEATWDRAREVLNRAWPRQNGGSMWIAAAAVDTGGQHTSGVYAQLRRMHDPRIIPIKGVPGWNRAAPVNGPTFVDVTQGGRKITRGLKLYTVSVDGLKADLYRRLWLTRGENAGYPAGWVHLPEGMDVEQVKQLVAEQLVSIQDRRGFTRREWQRTRANEQLDLAVYARAALTVLGSDRYGERFWDKLGRWKTPAEGEELPAAPRPEPVTIDISLTHSRATQEEPQPAPLRPTPLAPAAQPGPRKVEERGVTITYPNETPQQRARRLRISRLA